MTKPRDFTAAQLRHIIKHKRRRSEKVMRRLAEHMLRDLIKEKQND